MQATVVTKQVVSVDAIKSELSTRIDAAGFSAWIAPLAFKVSENSLIICTPNQFTADFVNATYSNILNQVASKYGMNVNVCVSSVAPVIRKTANDNNTQTYSAPVTNDKGTGDFDSFIASEENGFVVSACKKMAAGTAKFSPLFIYGPAGCGKTMLINCINSSFDGRVVMMSGAQFVSEFARALHDKTIFAFKDYCRKCDIFIMDDVHVLAGKRATCDEFVQLIVDLRDAGKNIVLTANAAPSNLSGFDHRLQSLLASGLVADIVAPSRSVRRQMFINAGVDTKIADIIAGRVLSNGHIISGILNKISTYSELMNESIDETMIESLLSDTLKKSKSPVSMVKSMCEKLGVSYDAICGNGRSRALVLARQMMMVVLKNVTNMSLCEIGSYVGGRDHATVMYGLDRIQKLQETDLVMSAQLAALIEEYK
ncbi:MAG: AAA family ATPase [Alphaproteobacteria bacterium]|nr:AAA family ATPase [Alphaproteobacteria bacterium]